MQIYKKVSSFICQTILVSVVLGAKQSAGNGISAFDTPNTALTASGGSAFNTPPSIGSQSGTTVSAPPAVLGSPPTASPPPAPAPASVVLPPPPPPAQNNPVQSAHTVQTQPTTGGSGTASGSGKVTEPLPPTPLTPSETPSASVVQKTGAGTESASSASPSSSASTTNTVGIAVGIVVVALFGMAIAVFVVRKRRRMSRKKVHWTTIDDGSSNNEIIQRTFYGQANSNVAGNKYGSTSSREGVLPLIAAVSMHRPLPKPIAHRSMVEAFYADSVYSHNQDEAGDEDPFRESMTSSMRDSETARASRDMKHKSTLSSYRDQLKRLYNSNDI